MPNYIVHRSDPSAGNSNIVLMKVLIAGCKKKAERILEKISETEISFQDIAMDFNFKSQAHFSFYCKRIFGLTPRQLRNK